MCPFPKQVLSRNSGFTLIDLVIAIMILGILAMIVMPQYHSVMTQTKLNGATGEVISALKYAMSLRLFEVWRAHFPDTLEFFAYISKR